MTVEQPAGSQPVEALTDPTVPVGRGWIALLTLSNLGLWMALLTPIQLLLPQQIAAIDPTGKVTALSWVTAAGAAVSMVAAPLAGALSDRTVSRFGRRRPWILGSTLVGAIALILVGSQATVWGIALCWMVAQLTLNGALAALSAAIPDRVPVRQRALVSAWATMPQVVGPTIGIAMVTLWLTASAPAYTMIAIALVVVTLLFVFLTPDDRLPARPPWSIGAFLRGFWVNPRKYPDFAWAFACRFLVMLGNAMATLYILYFLTNAVRYPDPNTGVLVVTLAFASALVVTGVGGGAISDRVGRRKIFVFGSSIVQMLACLILVSWQTWPATIATGLLLGAGYGLYLSVDQALITEVLPSAQSRARDLGIINIANSAPQVFAPVVAAIAITSFGGYRTLYLAAAVVTMLGAIAVMPIRSVR